MFTATENTSPFGSVRGMIYLANYAFLTKNNNFYVFLAP